MKWFLFENCQRLTSVFAAVPQRYTMSRKREEITKSAQSMTDVLALQHSYRVNKDVFIHSTRMNESFISEMFAYVAWFVGFLMNGDSWLLHLTVIYC